MAKKARRYDLFLPLTFNDGRPIPRRVFFAVESRLLARFHGLTAHQRQFPLKGVWQGAKQLYLDEVIIITILDFRTRGSARFLAGLKTSLLRELDQEAILITESALQVH